MPIINIYFKDKVYTKIKEEKNRSFLINSLLEEHYNRNDMTEEEVLANVKAKIEFQKQEAIDRENERKKLIRNALVVKEAQAIKDNPERYKVFKTSGKDLSTYAEEELNAKQSL